jgi:tRNA threonylcarbamoyl adenosine modification protein YeaZ
MPLADDAPPLELSIDTASDMASIALSREGGLVAELTWQVARDHGRQLVPATDVLLERVGATKRDLRAIFVCIGPGGYAGLRVGVTTAKTLAFALEVPIAGVGRLEVEAYGFAPAGGTVVAVHRAGRREYAWASYTADPEWRELSPPRLVAADTIVDPLPEGSLVTGDMDDALAGQLVVHGHRIARGAASVRRAGILAELGWRRLAAGRTDDPKSLVPLYLREPAIGPQA